VRFIVAAVSMILFTVSTVAMPWLVGLAINGYIYKSALTGLELTVFNIIGADFLNWLFFFIGNGLLNWGSQWLQLLSMAYIGRGIFYKLRTQMFNHLQTLSLSFYDRHEVGRIMSRVQNDVNSIQEVVTNGIINTVSDILHDDGYTCTGSNPHCMAELCKECVHAGTPGDFGGKRRVTREYIRC